MNIIFKALARSLKNWSDRCRPIEIQDVIPLAYLDRSNVNSQIVDLFFVEEANHRAPADESEIELRAYEELQTGTLRNSFYTGIHKRHGKVRQLQFSIKVAGAMEIVVFCVGSGKDIIRLKSITTQVSEDGSPRTYTAQIQLEGEIPPDARLFWWAIALHDCARIIDASWDAIAPCRSEGRMLVVLRTFGRTDDILGLLSSFNRQASSNSGYRRALRNIHFVVLDTSNGLKEDSYGLCERLDNLNCFVLEGPNMGGGGNMSQVLLAIESAVEQSGVKVDEMLLLDDDLSISMETLYRHWASTLFRSDNTLFTLPVFTKTDPRRMWEDGGFWGRFLDADHQTDRTAIAPRLLKHNLRFEGYRHLDEMAEANYPEYCTFIFLSLPYSQFEKLRFPLAFFLRGDDIEYSLRHNRAGGGIMSNPNLAAWHEPAHSYGQEYMSIAHGIIINMAYGQDKPDDFLSFFHKRALAHASVYDTLGLRLYTEILRDLNSRDIFLEHGFKDHYVQKLGFFRAFDAQFERLPKDVILQSLDRSNNNAPKIVRHGFLYMPVEAGTDLANVILENPHTGTVRLYRPMDPDNVFAVVLAQSELLAEMVRFREEFEDIKAHYCERIVRSSERQFWLDEMKLQDGGTRILIETAASTVTA